MVDPRCTEGATETYDDPYEDIVVFLCEDHYNQFLREDSMNEETTSD